jgi:SWIM zinc finger
MQEAKESNNATENTGTNRVTRGAWLAVNKRILKIKGRDAWVVPSDSKPGMFYIVDEDGTCECDDFKFHGVGCKHFVAVMGYDGVPRLRLERKEKKTRLFYQE